MNFKLTTNTFLAASTVLILSACSAPEGNQDVAKLQAKKDSLVQLSGNINAEIKALENQLIELTGNEEMVAVSAITLQPKTFEHYFTVQGNIETDKNALVFPETQGVVKTVHVSEGQRVSKGQLLVSLDTELIQRNINEVETNYKLAKDIFERQERLWEQKIGSEVQYLEAKNRKESLEATLATLNRQAGMGMVTAPFSGIVDEIVPKVGEMASPMMHVARVVSLNEMYLKADVSENYAGRVKEGMLVNVIVPGVDTLKSQIDRVGQFINPENRTFEITVALDESAALKPNMYAALEINDILRDSVITIPSSMIQEDFEGRSYVYTLTSAGSAFEVKKTFVSSGPSYQSETLIESGLKAGDKVVSKGARKVVDGEKVNLEDQASLMSSAQ